MAEATNEQTKPNHTQKATVEPSLLTNIPFLNEIWRYRYLLRNLVARDLKVRYKNSILGVVWSLLNPLLIVTVFTIVFSKFQGGSIQNYAIFVLVAMMPWNGFSASLVAGTNSIVGNAPLINKVYFPRILLPTTVVLSNLINMLISFAVTIAMLYVFGLGLSRHAAWVPIILVAQLMLTLGLVYFLSAAQVYYRDVGMIIDVGILALFFLTPIFYSLDQFCRTEMFGIVFDPARVMRWVNPMASIVDAYRTVLWGTLDNPVSSCGIADAVYASPGGMGLAFLGRTVTSCAVIMVVGFVFFRRVESRFAEEL